MKHYKFFGKLASELVKRTKHFACKYSIREYALKNMLIAYVWKSFGRCLHEFGGLWHRLIEWRVLEDDLDLETLTSNLKTLVLGLESYQNGVGCLNGSFLSEESYQIDNAI